jgi:hypothetical protein
MSLRAIGEGHVSSIGFCAAVIGPGPQWCFADRELPVVAGELSPTPWHSDQLRAVLTDEGSIDELSRSLLHALPTTFDASDLESALARAPGDLLTRPGAAATVDLLRRVVSSAYQLTFPENTALAQRILRPSAAEESGGMEDARFTRFISQAGDVEYRATYTAYDGHHIAPRLLLSPDLRHFRAHRPGPLPTTREWRCFRGWSTGGTWRCAARTARTSVFRAPRTATYGRNRS